ncbi:MAG: hypothetical protein HY074_06280, partial [Deltaproteobacteria bacterium]|nr:hypothetical protein [Deltaproteobacteria bacterium]
KLTTYFQQKVLRTDVLDGSGYGVEGVSVPPSAELRGYCEQLVGRLSYTGVGCVQFLLDSRTGKAYFLEINPRLDATCALPYRLGIDFPMLAVECAKVRAGLVDADSVRLEQAQYQPGRRAAWIVGDIFGLLHAIRHRKVSAPQVAAWVGRICISVVRNRMHITWESRDPLPTVFLFGSRLKSLFSNIARLFRGRLAPHSRAENPRLAK